MPKWKIQARFGSERYAESGSIKLMKEGTGSDSLIPERMERPEAPAGFNWLFVIGCEFISINGIKWDDIPDDYKIRSQYLTDAILVRERLYAEQFAVELVE